MSGKEFLIGFKPMYLKTRDRLELGGDGLALQQKTGRVFEEANQIGRGNLIPSTVQEKDKELLAQLNNILGAGKTSPEPQDGPSRPRVK